MGITVPFGLSIGLVLNTCADVLPANDGVRPSAALRTARWMLSLLISTALTVYLQWRYGWSLTFVMQAAYCYLLLLIAIIDLEHSLVPNALVLAGTVLALGFNALRPGLGWAPALLGAITGGGIFMLLALARRNALGLGDVKLAGLIGMMTGFPWVLQALTLGILLGGLGAGLLLLTRLRRPKQYMPYAPYLVAGSMATLLYGQRIATGYASLVGLGG